MNERFDHLSRAMAAPTSRRGALKLLGVTLAATAGATLLRPFACFKRAGSGLAIATYESPLEWDQCTGGAGLANLAVSIGTFGRTSVSSKVSTPESQVTVQRKGILIPETSR